MRAGLEPRIVHEWLEPLNLDLSGLLAESATRQAEIIRFYTPHQFSGKAVEISSKERAGLAVLGWAVGEHALVVGATKTLLQALFELFLALEEPETAAYLFQQAYPEPETQVTYFTRLVRLKLAQEDYEAAEAALSALHESNPASYSAFLAEAEIALHRQDWKKATEIYREALQTSPESVSLQVGLARCALEMGDQAEARRRLQRVEEMPQIHSGALWQIERLWRELGEAEKAAIVSRQYAEQRASKLEQLAGRKTASLRPEDGLEILPELGKAAEGEGLDRQAYEVLKEVFGHEEFRPGQEQVIASVLAGRDTLAVLPTGAGKSLCYQLPALLLSKPSLVLSPLISLMKDQFDKLPPALKAHTLIINSSLEPAEAARRLKEVSQPGNNIRLIYAAPERLRQLHFVYAMQRAGLGLLVVDEAHCVTMWGNDFRPDYLFIKRVLAGMGQPGPALLAVTATATPEIATEIERELGRKLHTVRGSIFRPNLSFEVEKVKFKIEERYERVAEFCESLEGSGIIYARSREKCEELAAFLNRRGLSAYHYHAGMDSEDRRKTQESWSKGRTRIIVATVAFGMGIDKPDVRFIIHLNPPSSLENYLQEAGRAGRDGQTSQCLLLYSSSDKANLSRWQREEREQLSLEMLRTIYRVVSRRLGAEKRGVVALSAILDTLYASSPALDETIVRVGLSLLERAGLLERSYDLPPTATVTLPARLPKEDAGLQTFLRTTRLRLGNSATINLVNLASELETAAPELEKRLLEWAGKGWLEYAPTRRDLYLELKEAGNDARARLEELLARMQQEADRRLDELEDYLKAGDCRQSLLGRHFGEKLKANCGVCDNCRKTVETKAAAHDWLHAGSSARTAPAPAPRNRSRARTGNAVEAISETEATKMTLSCLSLVTGNGEARVGRTGLVRLLLGQQSALGVRANNPYKGCMEGKLKVKEVEALVEKLITQGLIEEQAVARVSGGIYQGLKVSLNGQDWLDMN
ncbi:MAG TPA: RecQ family ATP-dependent DNA helicase [Chloroflexia bacterium]|nr:RecQ family ATP-dependent DNA helicase [Chloroflexia bacterium]